jgi:hypothetical protein
MSRLHPHKPLVQVPLLGGGSWLRPSAGWCAMAKGCVGRRPQAGFWPPGFCRPGGYEAMMTSFFFFFFFFVLLKSLPFFFQPPPPAAATTSRLITTQIPQLPKNTNQPNSTQDKQNQSPFQNNFFSFWVVENGFSCRRKSSNHRHQSSCYKFSFKFRPLMNE